MADRMALIMGLGGLAADAAQRGDDRAACLLREAVEFLVSDKADVEAAERAREMARNRQKRRRDGMSRSVTLRHVTERDPPGFSPTPPFPAPQENDDNSARAREDAEMVEVYIASLRNQLNDEQFRDVDEFVKRRPFETWRAWLREMVTCIRDGSQFKPDDLAQVCRDDAALTRPLGSPRGLRTFLGGAKQERESAGVARIGGTDGGQRRGNGAPAEAQRVVDAIRALIVVTHPPGQPNPSRFIPLEKVKAMGPVVLNAYKQLGGAGRFMDCPAEKLVFLVREMAEKMEGQRASA